MENNYCLYIHTAPNGKVYIGITRKNPMERWANGKRYKSSPHFWNAINKYGWENIKHEIIFTGLTKDNACQLEKSFIQMYDSTNPMNGYNETYGGEEGPKITDSVRKKISEANKLVYSDPERRKRLSERMVGYKHSKEAREKMSMSHTGLSHVATMEWKENIAKSLQNYYSLAENREKHKKDFERFAELGRRKSRRIEQFDKSMTLVATYESMKEAYRMTGIRDGNISKCCNGKTPTAGGYIWRFAS